MRSRYALTKLDIFADTERLIEFRLLRKVPNLGVWVDPSVTVKISIDACHHLEHRALSHAVRAMTPILAPG